MQIGAQDDIATDSLSHDSDLSDAMNGAPVPGTLRVIKRNGSVVVYDESKIALAMTRAFLAVEGGHAAASSRIHETVERLSSQVSQTFQRRLSGSGSIHIEDIQDQVELVLMRSGEYKVARAYVIYRDERHRARLQHASATSQHPPVHITRPDGSRSLLNTSLLEEQFKRAATGLNNIDIPALLEDTLRNLYDGVSEAELNTAMTMSARTRIELEPDYTFVTARLLLDQLHQEAMKGLQLSPHSLRDIPTIRYPEALLSFIRQGIDKELITPELGKFDLDRLGQSLRPERDFNFTYLGLQTLYDRYFIRFGQIRVELPQVFFMRVAMGLAIHEKNREERAIEFYELLSSFNYMASTPTLFNAGTLRPQLSSCYLTTIKDDLHGIFEAIHDNAMLSKWAGGLGNDWTPVRASGAHIQGTQGESQGVVPFLKVANDTAVAVNQGGKRKGAVCAYLETWHLDVEEFVELRKNTGDDRRRTHDMNTAHWIPDLFMKRVFDDGEWTLFSPNDVPGLHDAYGLAFEQLYQRYEEDTRQGKILLFKRLRARDLWRKMLSMLFETGHPWMTFKDPCNLRSPQQHVGVVHSSNLCTEITLNTHDDEIAVCNLGSINLLNHVTEQGLDQEKLKQTIRTAVRMLDNVIDINYYAVPQARRSNLKHRPVGLGIMGFQDALYQLRLAYASEAAVEFADRSMEVISYYAIESSCELAAERGSYPTYEGSLWSQGILPIDSLQRLEAERGAAYLQVDRSQTLNWGVLRTRVATVGMRNSNVMAIAPTATISNICGVAQSIEPTYQNLYVKSNLSGEFTVVNPFLVRELKKRGLWDNVMVNDLKYYDGSLQSIDRLPDDLKTRFATAFEIEPRWLIEAASRRQKWLDQAQSLNLYIAGASGKKLDITYRMAWYQGLKTTYYLRALAATSHEKSTLNDGTLNAVKPAWSPQETAAVPKACSIDNPDCESCQ
ncbi:MAG: ribonucleoside-diphosphate reductase subunit alpha [Pseudomonadales bacterium]|nr:ribonucleoside-diphosphate reductase subunit alpha [Pseudomonadales bacterium]